MKKFFLLVAFLMLSPSFALTNECNVTYSSSGAVEFTQSPDSFELEIRTFPQQCSFAPYEIVETQNGKILRIEETNPGTEYLWGFDCNFMSVSSYPMLDELLEFPHDFAASPEVALGNYTQFTHYTDCTEEMARTASEIVRGSRSVLEAGLKLARWVNSYLEYDMFYKDTIKTASWVFENRKGVCDEYSNLYVALARSVGIPARFVSGMAYTNILDDFGPHAWAEFYAGDWIPVDLTFGQYGTVDASHIATYYSEDAGFNTESITSFGQGTASFPSEPENYANAECESVSDFEIEAYIDRHEISDDDYAMVTVEIDNPYGHHIPLSVKFTRIDKVELMHGHYEDYIILSPFSRSIKNFLLHVQDLPEGYIYTMPISISADFAGQKNLTLTVITRNEPLGYDYYLSRMSDGMVFTPKMQMSSFEVTNPNYNSSATATFSVKNTGNDILNLSYRILVGSSAFSGDLGELLLNQEKEFSAEFPIASSGEFAASLEVISGNVSLSRDFLAVSSEIPELFISLNSPLEFEGGSLEFNASTPVCHSGVFSVETPTREISLALGNHSLSLDSGYFKPGTNSIALSVLCVDIYGTEFVLEREEEVSLDARGLGYILAWLKYLFNLVVSLFH